MITTQFESHRLERIYEQIEGGKNMQKNKIHFFPLFIYKYLIAELLKDFDEISK